MPFYPIKSLPKLCSKSNDSYFNSCCKMLTEIFLSYFSSNNSANNYCMFGIYTLTCSSISDMLLPVVYGYTFSSVSFPSGFISLAS